MSTSSFVHLHIHTEFSLADSTIRVPEKPEQAHPKKAKQANLLSRAVELGLPALAVTDLNNLFALIKFYKAAETVGIKPISGADLPHRRTRALPVGNDIAVSGSRWLPESIATDQPRLAGRSPP